MVHEKVIIRRHDDDGGDDEEHVPDIITFLSVDVGSILELLVDRSLSQGRSRPLSIGWLKKSYVQIV